MFPVFFQEQLNTTKLNMLLFNPILSQSRATQSLKNFRKRLRGVGVKGAALLVLANVRPSFISLFATLPRAPIKISIFPERRR